MLKLKAIAKNRNTFRQNNEEWKNTILPQPNNFEQPLPNEPQIFRKTDRPKANKGLLTSFANITESS